MAFENFEISPEELPGLKEISYRPHPVSLRTKQLLIASIAMFVLLIPLIVFIVLWLVPGIIISGIAWIFIALITYISILRGFPVRGYAVRGHDISYRKGWIFQKRTSVPFNRIQHSEIEQGPLDRKYGISSLKIFTAGGSSSDLVIPGLPPDEAQRLHEFITEQTARND